MRYPSYLLKITRCPKIPLRLRKKIGKALGDPTPNITFRAQLFDVVYDGVTGNHQDDKIYLYGAHEPATLRLLRAIAKWQKQTGQSPVYADIGTNAGQHLISTSKLCDAAFGFEPWPVAFDKATKEISINNFLHVSLFPFGLSNENAVLSYKPPSNNNLGTGMFVEKGNSETLELQLRRGDEVFDEESKTPTLIKIDTEGFEDRVLEGLKNILKSSPAVVFEYGQATKGTMPDTDSFRQAFGPHYKFFGISPSREYPVLREFLPHKRFENILAWPYSEDPRNCLAY